MNCDCACDLPELAEHISCMQLPSASSASNAVVGIGLVWAAIGGALLLATQYLPDPTSRIAYYVLSGVCLLIGSTTTHGLGGLLRHKGDITVESVHATDGLASYSNTAISISVV